MTMVPVSWHRPSTTASNSSITITRIFINLKDAGFLQCDRRTDAGTEVQRRDGGSYYDVSTV